MKIISRIACNKNGHEKSQNNSATTPPATLSFAETRCFFLALSMKTWIAFIFLLFLNTSPAFALYDPIPQEFLSASEGEWTGTLEYRDYQPPHKRVTLATELYASLSSPNELTLHYVFDDGPHKIVHSYDRLQIDLVAKTLRWSGLKAEDTSICTILSAQKSGDAFEIVAQRESIDDGKKKLIRYHLTLGAARFEIAKDEGPDPETLAFADRYLFRRK